MKNLPELFWHASPGELKKGYLYDAATGAFTCLICGELFERGRVYAFGEYLYEAEKAAGVHMARQHGDMFEYLVNLGKKHTGLTEHQKNMLRYFYQGYSDKEIAARLGGSASTVRNYRFGFREKEKQARVFLALMELLADHAQKRDELDDFQPAVKMIDERHAITEEEFDNIIKLYFKAGPDGPLSTFPGKEKRRVAILHQLVKRFSPHREYSEKEVNTILKTAYHDYVTLRRYLVEYGFISRTRDGSRYWVTV